MRRPHERFLLQPLSTPGLSDGRRHGDDPILRAEVLASRRVSRGRRRGLRRDGLLLLRQLLTLRGLELCQARLVLFELLLKLVVERLRRRARALR